MSASGERLFAGIGHTPVRRIRLRCPTGSHELLLKCEWHNPTGSIKDRTAAGLLAALDAAEPLVPGTVLVESTSGNLGIALARLVAEIDCHLIAVIDPRTPTVTRAGLTGAGADLLLVDEPDVTGGYLLNRLRKVTWLCAEHPDYRRPDQYANPANPLAHQRGTGPEVAAQGGADLDTVYVAVSTGGTLAGVATHLRYARPTVRIVAVDVRSSMALGVLAGLDAQVPGHPDRPLPGGRRAIPGIGSSRRSSFLSPRSYDRVAMVADAAAIAICQMLFTDTGLRIGGSSGCALLACVDDLLGAQPPRRPLCLCPDAGERYLDTLYNEEWLDRAGLLTEVKETHNIYRAAGLEFTLED